MYNYKMIIQYDGGRYKGWQKLGNGEDTIQGKLEKVLSELTGEETEVTGCSRTDAGVHALAQVANFKISKELPASDVKDYLNRYLPGDISVILVSPAPGSFQARYNARSKTYLYRIWNREYQNPFMRRYSMHIVKKLAIKNMVEAGRCFIGEHDFTAFSNAKSKKKSMVRNIDSINIKEEDGFIDIRITGDGFLHNMVRKIVGVMIEAGLGKTDIKLIPEIINSKERSQVGILAEACGLYLEKIEY